MECQHDWKTLYGGGGGGGGSIPTHKHKCSRCGIMGDSKGEDRVVTSQGLVRAGAVLTRSGQFSYHYSDLGLDASEGDNNGIVVVNRTIASLSHPETLASLRGVPLTLDHPLDGAVTPTNWRDTVVGSVVGEPRVEGNTIVADVLIGDQNAIAALEAGMVQLSIGYTHNLTKTAGGWETTGPLVANHVAQVPVGRAGPGVRVLDVGFAIPRKGGGSMNMEDIKKAVAEEMVKHLPNSNQADTAAVTQAVTAAITPLVDAVAKTQTDADEARKAKEARDAATKFEATIRDEERQRFAVLLDAMPLIPEDKRAEMATADAKDVLIVALGDSVTDAASKSLDYLRGALELAKKYQNTVELPAGVQRVQSADKSDPYEKHRRELESAYLNAPIARATTS